jgi:hypothetical protein
MLHHIVTISVCFGGHFESKMTAKIQKSFDLGDILCSELDEAFQKFCLTCVHIILRLRNFRVAAVATKNVKNLKCSELDET